MDEDRGEHAAPARPFLSNRTYDFIKFIAMIALPAAGALYFGLAEIWHLPKAHEVVGTVTVVDTFLGVILGISTVRYENSGQRYFGQIVVDDTGDKTVLETEFTRNPAEVPKQKEIIFKVVS